MYFEVMKKIPLYCTLFLLLITSSIAHSQTVLCARKTNGIITLRNKKCTSKETKISKLSQLKGETGSAGTNGTNGTDGDIKVWGDGSAGSVTFSSSYSDSNPQFTNITFESGSAFASGAVIRATGTCTINGAISIENSGFGGRYETITATTLSPATRLSTTGVSFTNAGFGEFGTNANTLSAGRFGIGLSPAELTSLKITSGHSSGGAGGPGYLASAGAAGGAFALYCKLGIVINASGSITANGGSSAGAVGGGGGGAGGFIFLASSGSIVNSGTISANGGDGGASSTRIGAGGGGSGGVVRAIAPVITIGTTSVTGGTAGSNLSPVTSSPRVGGSGGGGFGGDGGLGGAVSSDNMAFPAGSGASGAVITTIADPTSLIF
jgi:hypothetical protein